MTTRRRTLLGAFGAAATATVLPLGPLARPALAQGAATAAAATLRFVPQADLSSLDPIWTTGYVVRNHGYLVYDTLYAMDAAFNPQPQMAEGHQIEDDGRTWRIRLRPGLVFHDGQPVRAADCAASIRRWAARSSFGQALLAQLDAIETPDDRTLRVRLKSPFPLLAEALGTVSSPTCFIMPERVASVLDPAKQVTDPTGSGPFRFLADERVVGSRAAYARFDRYVPRDEPPDGLAGGKRARVDRVEWITIPDAGTAMAALQAGEVDWLEQPSVDLVPLVRTDPRIALVTIGPGGVYALLRFNHLFPPFDDVAARRAVLAAVDQETYMQAVVGGAGAYRDCKAFIPCGMPLSTGAGGDAMRASLEAGRALLKASRYDGRKVVVLSPSDLPALAAMGNVTAELLGKLGMTVDLQVLDWATLLARRNAQKPPEEGGWHVFHTTAVAPEFMSPASHLALRGNGRAAWAGWPTDPRIESLRQDWFAAPDRDAQRAVVAEMERQAFADVPYVPLGEYDQPTAYRRTVQDIVPAVAPVFWNLRKG